MPQLQAAARLGERFCPRSKSWLLENKLESAQFALTSHRMAPSCALAEKNSVLKKKPSYTKTK